MTQIFKFNKAIQFVFILGLISLFSDMTYEAARSINGPFLKTLGTNGTIIGLIAGLGELIGYGLRFISGYIADKTKKYWLILIIGYCLNLFSVPLLALAGYWQIAAVLMISERIGKAIRTAPRDALLSFGTQQIGRGWGYGLHEAMDQIGAFTGPILVSIILFLKNQKYSLAYSLLIIPATIAIALLLYCKYLYPNPENLEIKNKYLPQKKFSKQYWIYVLAIGFIAAGFVDFPLIAYHFKTKAIMNDTIIPIFYSIAMATDAITALITGKLFDKIGIKILIITTILSSLFVPMVFKGNFYIALVGIALWGIGMGSQESIVKAQIANMVSPEKRSIAFGSFHFVFGIFWFLGSSIMGFLYDVSLNGLIAFSIISQLLAVILISYLYVQTKNNKIT